MIVDAHTHVFPPKVIAGRSAYVDRDTGFARLYAGPHARMASAEELLASMDRAGIDIAVAANFAWGDSRICTETNEYLCAAAARSGGRLLAFGMVQPAQPEAARREVARLADAGAAGIGELRADDQGYSLDDPAVVAVLRQAADAGLVLMFHVSEPVGHQYPGKQGLGLAPFVRLAAALPDARLIAAHWGGGLPFYTLMLEVREALANTWFDSAATTLLYRPEIYRQAAALCGADRILFGSDYPLLSQGRQRAVVEEAGLAAADLEAILGGNASALFGLTAPMPAREVAEGAGG